MVSIRVDYLGRCCAVMTRKGTSELYFTADSIKNLKEGEQVVLELETPGYEASKASWTQCNASISSPRYSCVHGCSPPRLAHRQG